jgi:hypothetical protein
MQEEGNVELGYKQGFWMDRTWVKGIKFYFSRFGCLYFTNLDTFLLGVCLTGFTSSSHYISSWRTKSPVFY